MTARAPYKPEGFPKRAEFALMSSQDVKDHESEVRLAMEEFDILVHDHYNGFEDAKDEADERLVVAYRALKAWEASRT